MKKFLIFCLLCLSVPLLRAQEIEIDWSKPIVCDNKNFGFFETFIGSNNEFVYAKYVNMALSRKNQNSSVRIVAYDKETMKPVKEKVITGFKSEASKGKAYNGKTFYSNVVFDDQIIIFWLEHKDKKTPTHPTNQQSTPWSWPRAKQGGRTRRWRLASDW
jgi:hypothetical protein